MNKVRSLLRQATRKKDKPLNILTFCTHERSECSMARCGHNFYAFNLTKNRILLPTWNSNNAPIPNNYTILENSIPTYIDIDIILSQSREYQFEGASKLANSLGIPIISLQHTLPNPDWNKAKLYEYQQRKGDINVFVSSYSRNMWGGDDRDFVNMTGIDLNIFSPDDTKKDGSVLTVAHEFIKRNTELGFDLWVNTTGFPEPFFKTRVVGNTPGLSTSTQCIADLVKTYRMSSVYLNTTVVSTLPTAIIEAMACGLPIVSTKTCLIPEMLVEHGVNGFVSNDENELRNYCQILLDDKDRARKMGEMSRKRAEKEFSVERFANKWNEIFRETAGLRTL